LLTEPPAPQRPSLSGTQRFWVTARASSFGAAGLFLLLLTSFIPVPYLALGVIPGFLAVFLATGRRAVHAAGQLTSPQPYPSAGEIGWTAGFWTGVHGGNMAMLIAAAGFIMDDFGQDAVRQLTPEQLSLAAAFGFDQMSLALAARVVGAFLIYGLIGSLIAALVAAVGGMTSVIPSTKN
jgi:hypothetical protein